MNEPWEILCGGKEENRVWYDFAGVLKFNSKQGEGK